jgi:hypothetical protein
MPSHGGTGGGVSEINGLAVRVRELLRIGGVWRGLYPAGGPVARADTGERLGWHRSAFREGKALVSRAQQFAAVLA